MVIIYARDTKKIIGTSGESLAWWLALDNPMLGPYEELADIGAAWPTGVDPKKAYWIGGVVVELTDAEINQQRVARWNDIYPMDWKHNGGIYVKKEFDCGNIAINGQLAAIQLGRGKGGISGQTVVNIRVKKPGQAPYSVFTDPDKRPRILASAGDRATAIVTDIDIRGLGALDYIMADIDEVELGPADNLHARALAKPSGTY